MRTISNSQPLSGRSVLSTATPRFTMITNPINQENEQLIEDLEYDNQELKTRLNELEAHIDSLNEDIRKQKRTIEEKSDELGRLKNQVCKIVCLPPNEIYGM
jgi:chromosome segregation ATPase